jgi:hypothetical protein
MRIDDCLAPIQFGEHGRERGVPQPGVAVTGEHADAVSLEGVERVLDFLETPLDIGKWQHGEQAESALVVRHHLRGGVLVHLPGQPPRLLRVAEMDAWRRDRQHRGRDADAIQFLDGTSRRVTLPRREPWYRRGRVPRIQRCVKARRHEVLVDVDATRRAGRGLAEQGVRRQQ